MNLILDAGVMVGFVGDKIYVYACVTSWAEYHYHLVVKVNPVIINSEL
jgi:hypothetical protein